MNPPTASTKYVYLPWALMVVVTIIAVVGWASSLGWQLRELSVYQIFPVFGLTAFSIMWSQYVIIYLRARYLAGIATRRYFTISGYIVLVLILLHPSLLVAQRWIDGFGLPPGSYLSYVGATGAAAVLTGTLSLLIFLTFELRRYFRQRRWCVLWNTLLMQL